MSCAGTAIAISLQANSRIAATESQDPFRAFLGKQSGVATPPQCGAGTAGKGGRFLGPLGSEGGTMDAAMPAVSAAEVNAFRIQESVGAANGTGTHTTVETLATKPLDDPWIYRIVVSILGVVMLTGMIGSLILAKAPSNPPAQIPDIFLALGSAAVGALAGLLAPSPSGKR
jgi:hypothetical protein